MSEASSEKENNNEKVFFLMAPARKPTVYWFRKPAATILTQGLHKDERKKSNKWLKSRS